MSPSGLGGQPGMVICHSVWRALPRARRTYPGNLARSGQPQKPTMGNPTHTTPNIVICLGF